ncbi:MAG: hypothetical protein IT384_15760 [Deltaproteobacteria bacterium]|nr:hypothetical protein [Deltaproteobacteria bacterium]
MSEMDTRTTTKKVSATDEPRASAAPSSPSAEVPGAGEEPAKKKRKKYSKGLKSAQRFEEGMTKAQRRLAKAVYEGLSTWNRTTDRSARKKKDGALRDVMKNSAKATEKAIRVAARAPRDFVKTARPIKPKRVVRVLFPFL